MSVRAILLSALGLISFDTWAQDAGALLRQQEQLQQNQQLPLPPRELPRAQEPLRAANGETIKILSIRFSGATELVPEGELQQLVADAIGQDLDFAALQQLAERVTSYLKSKGWFLARAYLPQQDVTDGVVEIAILAGRLSQEKPIEIVPGTRGLARMSPELLARTAAGAIPSGQAINEAQVDRAVLLMNDLPGVNARARLKPGEKPDETRLELVVDEGDLFNGSFSADNFGSKSTGTDQLNASAILNNPSGLGDQFSLAATHTQGLDLGRAGYSITLPNGLKVSLNYSDMQYEVRTYPGKTYRLQGEASTRSGTLSYPLLRGRTANVLFGVTASKKHLIDTSMVKTLKDKTNDSLGMQLSGDMLDTLGGGGLTNWSLIATQGTIDLSGSTDDLTQDRLGFQTDGYYEKLGFSLSRLQRLPDSLTLNVSINGQLAKNNLDSSEKIYLGGPNGVRAYPGSEAGGDAGVVSSLELRYDWPGGTPIGNLQLQAFYDAGWVQLHKFTMGQPIETASRRNRYELQGAGLGAVLSKAGGYSLRAVWARPLGSNPGRSVHGMDSDGESNRYRLWLQCLVAF